MTGREIVNRWVSAGVAVGILRDKLVSEIDDAIKAEREACAAYCEAVGFGVPDSEYGKTYRSATETCAAKIRDRGKQA